MAHSYNKEVAVKSFKVFGLALLLSVFLAGTAHAADLKIAYVNLAKVFDEYNKTKEYDAALEKKHEGYKKEFDDRMKKVQEAEAKLPLLKDAEKAKLQSQVDQDKSALSSFERDKTMDLRKERDERIRELLGEIEKVITDFAQKENYSLVINDRVLVYTTKEMDITDQVIKLLNEKYPAKDDKGK